MESPTLVCGVPFRQKPHLGQIEVFEKLQANPSKLNIQLPTGYGKTFTAAGCYSILSHQGRVNRLLWVVSTEAQREQLAKDGPRELELAGVAEPREIDDVSFFGGARCIQYHRANKRQAFVITIQSLIQARGANNVGELMQNGRWMVVVDEHHHLGFERAWGRAVKALPAQFILAMSATPYRADDDNAFGRPDVVVSYRAAKEQSAVKPLYAHAYHYRIDAVSVDGEVISYTTEELAREAGGADAEHIERHRIERQMRWSPKYISPLVTIPIDRMVRKSLETGADLQALVKAMSVSHAELVCGQIKTWRPDVTVDWVGTGPNGRDDDTNKAIMKKFCPPKDRHGVRHPELDVLVCVGMAGEGLDATNVSEIVHLHQATKNNTNDQVNGRASRALKDANGEPVVGNVNFDACSEYTPFTGDRIMDAMDGEEGEEPKTRGPNDDDETGDWPAAPEEPPFKLVDMYLERIDSGTLEQTARAIMQLRPGAYNLEEVRREIHNPDSEIHQDLVAAYRNMTRVMARDQDEKTLVLKWKEAVERLLSSVTARTIAKTHRPGTAKNQSLAGDIKKAINRRKALALGSIANDLETCKAHYRWLQGLDVEVKERGAPSWLALS